MRRYALPAGLLAAFLVLLVLVATHNGPLLHLDSDLAARLHRVALRHPAQVTWWKGVSAVLHPEVLRALAAVAVVVLWLKRRVAEAALVAVAMLVAAVLESVLKAAVGRHRPVFAHPVAHATGGSFVSGHAMTSVVAFGLLVLLVPRARPLVAAAAAGAVLLVGYSRLALGVHYLSDVVGGWLLGLAVLTASWQLLRHRSRARA